MNCKILLFLIVAAIAAFTADAMVFGVPMGGLWRNFGGFSNRKPFGMNFLGDHNGLKFVPAFMVPPASSATATNGEAAAADSHPSFVPLGGIPAALRFPF